MSPAPRRRHQQLVVEVVRQLGNQLLDKPCEVYAAPFDVRLPVANEADEEIETVVQPDITVVCDEEKLDDAGCRGAPTFVIEILSPQTATKDLIVKRQLYERAGVREYWGIHPTDRFLHIWRLNEEGRYGAPILREATGTLEIEALPGMVIDLDRLGMDVP